MTSGARELADMAQTLRAQRNTVELLAVAQSQHNEKLDRHEESLTAAHGKLDRIIIMLKRLPRHQRSVANPSLERPAGKLELQLSPQPAAKGRDGSQLACSPRDAMSSRTGKAA